MNRKTKIIIILIILLGLILIFGNSKDISYETLADTDIGSVEVGICGNENATKCIALITGMHPREPLSIGPEIEAAKQFGGDDVKIIHYKVTVTRDA